VITCNQSYCNQSHYQINATKELFDDKRCFCRIYCCTDRLADTSDHECCGKAQCQTQQRDILGFPITFCHGFAAVCRIFHFINIRMRIQFSNDFQIRSTAQHQHIECQEQVCSDRTCIYIVCIHIECLAHSYQVNSTTNVCTCCHSCNTANAFYIFEDHAADRYADQSTNRCYKENHCQFTGVSDNSSQVTLEQQQRNRQWQDIAVDYCINTGRYRDQSHIYQNQSAENRNDRTTDFAAPFEFLFCQDRKCTQRNNNRPN